MALKESLVKGIIKHPVRITFGIAIILFIFAYIFLGGLRCVDYYFKVEEIGKLGILTRLNGGVEAWYAFFGSYLGAIATVILGIVTLRLDMKINRLSQAAEINTLTVSEIRLYDLWRDYIPSAFREGDVSKRFILHLIFDKFEPYYEIDVGKVEWGLIDEKHFSTSFLELEHPLKVQTKAKKHFDIYLNFDDVETSDLEKTFNFYYRIQHFEPVMMRPHERQRSLKLHMKLKKMLYSSRMENTNVILEIIVENTDHKDGYILLEEKNCTLTISNE